MTRALVIGGGISGMSVAFHLAAALAPGSVQLLEAEPELAWHTTSRSAAMLTNNFGPNPVRSLTRASVESLAPWLTPRGLMTVAGETELGASLEYESQLLAEAAEFDVLANEDARAICGILRPEASVRAIYELGAADIDVMGLFDFYARGLRDRAGMTTRSARVSHIAHHDSGWQITAGANTFDADIIVNAAGAWGDDVARLAGVPPVGLEPRRRTALLAEVGAVDPAELNSWPMVAAMNDEWYFKPNSGALLISPVDATPVLPQDARPDDLDVTLALERVNDATTLGLRRVRTAWAGLRTFAPDGIPVFGPDPAVPDFVWAVGQGGYGIQSAPANGALVAALTLGAALPDWLAGIDPADTAPERLRR
jgi:D-arginine dehydrogenase